MADSECILEIADQAAVKVATVVIMEFINTETGPQQRIKQTSWKLQGKDIETGNGEIKI